MSVECVNDYAASKCLDGPPLLDVVDRKLAHPRCLKIQATLVKKLKKYYARDYSPLTRAHMLAVVMYTGCDCNYAMCAAERSGDRQTWQWFS